MKLYRNTTALILITLSLLVLSIVVLFNDIPDSSITGYDVVNTKVELFPTQFKNCTFQLNPGWNMVSFYCFGMYVERGRALASIENSYESIFEYTTNDLTDPWKSYTISLPNWTVQQLNYMDRISGYWIYMIDNATFEYSGVYSDSKIYLYDGWNLVGYPLINASNINDSLTDISYSMVKYYNNTANIDTNYTSSNDTWLIYVKNGSNNTLNNFETYKGYWINVSGNQQWTITR